MRISWHRLAATLNFAGVLVLLFAANAIPQAHGRASDFAGRYNVSGMNPDGGQYSGTLEIIPRGNVYQFRWNAGTQYDGIGIRNGKYVAVAFASGSDGTGCGVVDYTIMNDGTLDGRWGYWGQTSSGTERATRLTGRSLDGEYTGGGINPNGTRYQVKISVRTAGSGYHFTWSNNSEGFGIRRGDNVAVGIGGERCGFVSYEIKPDGALDGIWGGYGSERTGTENATRH
jgi:hypothetical protein